MIFIPRIKPRENDFLNYWNLIFDFIFCVSEKVPEIPERGNRGDIFVSERKWSFRKMENIKIRNHLIGYEIPQHAMPAAGTGLAKFPKGRLLTPRMVTFATEPTSKGMYKSLKMSEKLDNREGTKKAPEGGLCGKWGFLHGFCSPSSPVVGTILVLLFFKFDAIDLPLFPLSQLLDECYSTKKPMTFAAMKTISISFHNQF
jgi:hypothetical protein